MTDDKTERLAKWLRYLRSGLFPDGDLADFVEALAAERDQARLEADGALAIIGVERGEIAALRERLAEAVATLADTRVELKAANEIIEQRVPRFPDHMAKIVAAKNENLPERIKELISAMEALPEHLKQYQWQADEKQAFGSKWVRSVCGNNGRGMGLQAIAEVVSHLNVADYIAAANPDTIALLLAALADARREGREEGIREAADVCHVQPSAFAARKAILRLTPAPETPADQPEEQI